MNSPEYLEATTRTDLPDYNVIVERLLADPRTLLMLHAVFGMVTEVGELTDGLKKYLLYGKPIDRVNVVEEHGDLMWYEALLHKAFDYMPEEARQRNIAKLLKRYPEKFTEHHALNRDLDNERKVLEQ